MPLPFLRTGGAPRRTEAARQRSPPGYPQRPGSPPRVIHSPVLTSLSLILEGLKVTHAPASCPHPHHPGERHPTPHHGAHHPPPQTKPSPAERHAAGSLLPSRAKDVHPTRRTRDEPPTSHTPNIRLASTARDGLLAHHLLAPHALDELPASPAGNDLPAPHATDGHPGSLAIDGLLAHLRRGGLPTNPARVDSGQSGYFGSLGQ
jgi:hypothetical protein